MAIMKTLVTSSILSTKKLSFHSRRAKYDHYKICNFFKLGLAFAVILILFEWIVLLGLLI